MVLERLAAVFGRPAQAFVTDFGFGRWRTGDTTPLGATPCLGEIICRFSNSHPAYQRAYVRHKMVIRMTPSAQRLTLSHGLALRIISSVKAHP